MRMKNFMNHGCTKELTQVYSSINYHSRIRHNVRCYDKREVNNMEYFDRIMSERDDLLSEIDDVLDDNIMSHKELLYGLLRSMETAEIRENWNYIKRMHEIEIPSCAELTNAELDDMINEWGGK
jgi:hypothetical protein